MKKNNFQAQRDVIKSLAEGGPGSTRWGDRTANPKDPGKTTIATRFKALQNSTKKYPPAEVENRLKTAASLRATRKVRSFVKAPEKATAKKILKLNGGDKAMIRQIVGKLHVGRSNRDAIKTVAHKIRGFHKLTRGVRRDIMKTAVKAHKENGSLYNYVMGARKRSR